MYYAYDDCRKLEQSFFLWSSLQISENTDIIGISITIKCMEWWTSQFKLVLQSAIGGLTLLLNIQDIFHLYVPPEFHETRRICLLFKMLLGYVGYAWMGGDRFYKTAGWGMQS